jgi:hypothetical protein
MQSLPNGLPIVALIESAPILAPGYIREWEHIPEDLADLLRQWRNIPEGNYLQHAR